MAHHLFLEGPVQSGKSTLLRRLLLPYMDKVGGFTSQRLLDVEGRTKAFRIGPARETPLTAPYYAPGTQEYASAETHGGDGIFRVNRNDGRFGKFPQVFRREGVSYLTSTLGMKLILLDEIGGAEMQEEEFRRALYRLLGGEIPCIGVIKLEKKAAFMTETVGYEKSVVNYNRELRNKLRAEYHGRIIPFRREDDDVILEVKNFICGIFMTN